MDVASHAWNDFKEDGFRWDCKSILWFEMIVIVFSCVSALLDCPLVSEPKEKKTKKFFSKKEKRIKTVLMV